MKCIYLALIFLFNSFVFAQDFNSINSDNVLNYLSNQSNTNLIQNGDDNYMNLILKNSSIVANQNGNNNVLNYDSKSNQIQHHSIQVSTFGNNNIIDIYGTNSISNGMAIDVHGNNKTIIINNR